MGRGAMGRGATWPGPGGGPGPRPARGHGGVSQALLGVAAAGAPETPSSACETPPRVVARGPGPPPGPGQVLLAPRAIFAICEEAEEVEPFLPAPLKLACFRSPSDPRTCALQVPQTPPEQEKPAPLPPAPRRGAPISVLVLLVLFTSLFCCSGHLLEEERRKGPRGRARGASDPLRRWAPASFSLPPVDCLKEEEPGELG